MSVAALVRVVDLASESAKLMVWERRPFCLAVLGLCFTASVVFGITSTRNMVTGDFSTSVLPRSWHVANAGQDVVGTALLPLHWLCSHIVAPASGELVLLVVTTLTAGNEVERLLGPGKTALLIALVALIRLFIQIGVNVVWSEQPWFALPPSVAWIGIALCVARRLLTVPQRCFVVANSVSFSEQIFTDALALQFALISSQPLTLWVTAVATCIALSDAVGVAQLRDPLSRLPWLRAKVRLPPRVQFFAPDARRRRNAAPARAAGPSTPRPAVAQPATEHDIQLLTELGFSQEQAQTALARARGNVHVASAMLLDGEVPLVAP